MDEPSKGDERRRYLRLRDNFRVELNPWAKGPDGAPQEEDVESLVGFSTDLSVGGVCLVADTSPALGSVVDAVIHAAELEAALSIIGEVVRADARADGRYDVALRFASGWIDEDVRQQLEQLVYG